ncbi:hypothetical protein UPYG_G00108870 [Umbra pygmaea]|uniref:Uncharacterized protein n=1 Tax=Umbra pygmaea TaxID=75934 RepID=A0ABD0X6A0_UMBPY
MRRDMSESQTKKRRGKGVALVGWQCRLFKLIAICQPFPKKKEEEKAGKFKSIQLQPTNPPLARHPWLDTTGRWQQEKTRTNRSKLRLKPN